MMRFKVAWCLFWGIPFAVIDTGKVTLFKIRTKPNGRQFVGREHQPRWLDDLPQGWVVVARS